MSFHEDVWVKFGAQVSNACGLCNFQRCYIFAATQYSKVQGRCCYVGVRVTMVHVVSERCVPSFVFLHRGGVR